MKIKKLTFNIYLMLKKLSRYFHNITTTRSFIIIFLAMMIYPTLSLPILYWLLPVAKDLPSLDAPVFYSADELFSVLQSLF